jgi:hypothetical protein
MIFRLPLEVLVAQQKDQFLLVLERQVLPISQLVRQVG